MDSSITVFFSSMLFAVITGKASAGNGASNRPGFSRAAVRRPQADRAAPGAVTLL